MPAFGIAQSGPFGPPNQGLNVTSIVPGDNLVLFDGTETPLTGLASIAFSRGTGQGPGDGGSTFNLTGMPSDMTVDVEVCSPPNGGFASVAAMNSAFSSVTTMIADSGGNSSYTDLGRSQFYRLKITLYTTGTMPVGVVQR